jgi:anti-sigma regulatory factor (Ser/Thr protein kinase)
MVYLLERGEGYVFEREWRGKGRNSFTMKANSTFPVDISEIDNIYKFVTRTFSQEGLDTATIQLFMVAADEIFSNVVYYGFEGSNKDASEKIAEVSVNIEESAVSMAFRDNGIPFDPLSSKAPDASLSLEDKPIGGLGIHIVKNSFDEVCYSFEDGFNVLSLKKIFKGIHSERKHDEKKIDK